MRFFKSKDDDELLKRFLSYVGDASKEVKNTNRPILVLVFGHGEERFNIMIGGKGSFEKCSTLKQFQLQQALLQNNLKPNLALLTTSCCGVGWAQLSFLDITAMAGVNSKEQLLSSPHSPSMHRCCGSRYATGVAQALMKMEIEDLDLQSNEGDEFLSSATYVSLVACIRETLFNEVDVRERNTISFSAKDEVWDMQWRARTGFPLAHYEQKWQSLRRLEAGQSSNHSQMTSIRFSDTVSMSAPEAEYRLKRLAYTYMRSYPGLNLPRRIIECMLIAITYLRAASSRLMSLRTWRVRLGTCWRASWVGQQSTRIALAWSCQIATVLIRLHILDGM